MRMWRDQRGMSLIEMLVAMVLLALVVVSFYQLAVVGVRGWGALEGQLDVQQHPRVAAQRLVSEVRQAKDFTVDSAGSILGLVKVTILTQDAAAGDTSVVVEDPSPLVVSRPIVLLNLNRLEQVTVTAIAGTTVSFAPALAFPHKQGELVRRAQSTLSAGAGAGATTLTVASGAAFQVNDPIAVEDEGALTVTAVAGDTLTITPALAQSHSLGAVVQPLSVVLQLTGTQLTRCTQGCNNSANQVVLADFLAPPAGAQLFSAVKTTLAAAAILGDTQVCVQSTAGFAVNDRVQIDRDTYAARVATIAERRLVTSITTSVGCPTGLLILDAGLTSVHASGEVARVSAVDIKVSGTRFNDVIQQTQEVSVTSRAFLRN